MAELSEQAAQPNLWDEPQQAQRLLDEMSHLKAQIEQVQRLIRLADDLEVLLELGEEEGDLQVGQEAQETFQTLQRGVEQLELQWMLSQPHDRNNALLTLHAGAGGTEAMDWCQMLLRMYTRWAENHGYTVTLLDELEGEEAGIKSATLRIAGEYAYGYLRSEHGVHRLVRISPFDANARRHTSFASVEVLPEIDEEDQEIEIRPEDLRIDTFRSSGAGGQHVNKTESAVRITHLPTGIVVSCQNERSQIQNRAAAMTVLRAKLYQRKLEEQQKQMAELKGEQREIAWGSQIRSYVFQPYQMVKDHRTGVEMGNVQAVMDGEIDPFIEAYLRSQIGVAAPSV